MPVSLQIQSRRRELGKSADDLLRFAKRARLAAGLKGTVSILVESSERLQAMNRYFRHKDKPTDVLSFPAATAVQSVHAGDIAISADIAAANARALGHETREELKVLILHGMLHLAGHDHETDSGAMAKLERKLRAELRLPDSLTERAKNTESALRGKKTKILARRSAVKRSTKTLRSAKSTR